MYKKSLTYKLIITGSNYNRKWPKRRDLSLFMLASYAYLRIVKRRPREAYRRVCRTAKTFREVKHMSTIRHWTPSLSTMFRIFFQACFAAMQVRFVTLHSSCSDKKKYRCMSRMYHIKDSSSCSDYIVFKSHACPLLGERSGLSNRCGNKSFHFHFLFYLLLIFCKFLEKCNAQETTNENYNWNNAVSNCKYFLQKFFL